MSSPHVTNLLREGSRATTQAAFGIQKVRVLPLPLPPLLEQERIVAEVERKLSVVDTMEKTVAANLKRAERMRQAILQRAFSGRLVPHDANDEPASLLLERIRAERKAQMAQNTHIKQNAKKRNVTVPKQMSIQQEA